MTSDALRQSYDAVPYDSRPVPQSHPDRLNALGRLKGLRPAPVENARVLEIGCASGGNLIPMAAQLPQSRFVGIDLSPTQIAAAHDTTQALSLDNIDFHFGDVTNPALSENLGTFDYVIAHGLYSWVPEPVQQVLLPLIAQLMAPDGMAYVSYNTYPGWHQRAVVRQFLNNTTDGIAEPAARAAAARNAIAQLSQSHLGDAAYGALLAGEHARIAAYDDRFLLHDLMEAENHPVWFGDFARRASNADLRFVCESNLSASNIDNFASEVRDVLAGIDDEIAREQRIDFWLNRSLRETLLCRGNQTVGATLDRNVLPMLWAGTSLRHDDAIDLTDGIEMFFRTGDDANGDGARIGLRAASAKQALSTVIAAAPGAVEVELLCGAVGQRDAVLDLLLALVNRNLIELSPRPPAFVAKSGERPTVSSLVRHQLQSGTRVTNQRHQSLLIDDPLTLALLPLLDGRHTKVELVDAFAAASDQPHDLVAQTVDTCLAALVRNALLVA